MKLMVIRLIVPSRQLLGYLKRFMLEMDAGMLVGSGNKRLIEEVEDSLRTSNARGFLIVSNTRNESGYEVKYYRMDDERLIDFDGIVLLEKAVKSFS